MAFRNFNANNFENLPHGDGQGLPVLDLEWMEPSSDMVGVSRCRGVTSLPRLLARDLQEALFSSELDNPILT